MAADRATAARGALAGAVAAAVWTAQQPLDQKVFGVPYDDTEILGKLVTRGPLWRPVGFAMHLVNGALFGAAYAAIAPRVHLPSWSRGPLAGLTEHVATWPLMALVPVLHPAAKDFPPMATNPRAFAQSAWRHLVFGTVLGEIERRLNGPDDVDVPSYDAVVSSNGHGDLERALSGAEQ